MGTRFVPEVLTGKRNEAGIARGESPWEGCGVSLWDGANRKRGFRSRIPNCKRIRDCYQLC
jgi:hypothetical protein